MTSIGAENLTHFDDLAVLEIGSWNLEMTPVSGLRRQDSRTKVRHQGAKPQFHTLQASPLLYLLTLLVGGVRPVSAYHNR